jgi:hypothetical protein
MMEQRMFENRLAERGAMFGVGKSIGHGSLCQRDADHAVRYAREVQDFED